MKTIKDIILSIFLILIVYTSCNAKSTNSYRWFSEGGVIIDTRTHKEFNKNHIAGALNIPFKAIKKEITNHVKNKETPILLYCRSGRRSAIAAKILKKMGYTQIINIGSIKKAITFIQEYEITKSTPII